MESNQLQLQTSNQKLKILICGAGIAGLALANCLQKFKSDLVDFTIIEKDNNFDCRAQGYSLTIQTNGQEVFRQLDLYNTLVNHPDAVIGRGHKLFTPDGTLAVNSSISNKNSDFKKDKSKQYVYLPRQEVRRIFLNNLSANIKIRWGISTLDYKYNNITNQTQVQFSDNSVDTFDLIVGCEGIFSKIRQIIVNDDLLYLNVLMINGLIEHKNQIEIIHSYSIVGDCKSRLFFKPFKPGWLMWQLTFQLPLEEAINISENKNPQVWLSTVLNVIGQWKHKIIDLIKETQLDKLRCGPLFCRKPISLEKLAQFNNFILIGDSCHPMPPFKGQGANQALEDTLFLMSYIDQIKDNKQKIAEYMENIIKRSQVIQQASIDRVEMAHSEKILQYLKDLSKN